MKTTILSNGLRIQTPAKLNLFFEVLGKRADDYHEIETITTLIDLYDILEIRRNFSENQPFNLSEQSQITFQCIDSQGNELDLGIPDGKKNLVVQAFELFCQKTGKTEPISIQLTKRIPSQAGLGGGSSDAAATLWGLNELWQTRLNRKELQKIAAELGSDVPLFLEKSGIVWGKGRGEIVQSLNNIPETNFILIKPHFGLATAAVYSQCEVIKKNDKNGERSVASILNLQKNGLTNNWPYSIFNRLEEAASLIWENLEKFKKKLKLFDVLGVQMTGSGSCFFAICPDQATADRIYLELHSDKKDIDWICSAKSSFH